MEKKVYKNEIAHGSHERMDEFIDYHISYGGLIQIARQALAEEE